MDIKPQYLQGLVEVLWDDMPSQMTPNITMRPCLQQLHRP